MAAQLFYLPFRPALDMNGISVAGAKAYFYLTGTNTLAPVYSESTLTTIISNPVEADAAGRWPSIYLDDTITYRVVIKDASDVTIPGHDVDPYLASIADALTTELQDVADAAALSASSAATSASSAATSASNASTSASNAATSASNASTSATAADTSADNAAISEANAAASALAADTSADNAATSEANAAASALSAAGATWEPEGAWLTATAYTVNPRSIVTEGGSSYACLVAHTSGTFATDLAAAKWELIAEKGADGIGGGTVTSVSGTGTASGLTLTGTVTSSGNLTLGGTLSATSANISDFNEAVDDRVDALLVEGSNITLTYDDVAGTLTVASTASGGPTYSKATADQTTTSATAVDITNLAFTPAANTTYEVEAVLIYKNTSAGNNFKFGMAWPTGLTTGVMMTQEFSTGTVNSTTRATNSLGTFETSNAGTFLSSAIASETSFRLVKIKGLIVAGATPSGSFKLQCATTGGTATIGKGSYIKYTAI